MKAAAFSDAAWLDHWDQHGPTLVARGWASLYPHLPLAQVERATGVGFLVTAVGGEGVEGGVGDLVTGVSGEGVEGGVGDLVRATESLVISEEEAQATGNRGTADTSETVVMETTNQTPKASCAHDPEPRTLTSATDEELQRLWGEHYNTYYWYCYQQWRGGQGEGEAEVVVIGPQEVGCLRWVQCVCVCQ